MEKDDLDLFLTALENSTRREILKRLTLEDSYALEISRWIGVSQQAINKQLEMLERARLVNPVGMMPSSSGAPRKIYRPTNFSSIVIDYSKSFFEVKKYDIEVENEITNRGDNGSVKGLVDDLREVNNELDDLMNQRMLLLAKKDSIIMKINNRISRENGDNLLRSIVSSFLETLNEDLVAEKLSVPPEVVRIVVSDFLKL